MQNDVRDSYFCNLDVTSRRVDAPSRPELMYGTVDIVAPADYLLKKPSKATILFALETSRASVQSGAFMAYVQAVKQFLMNPTTAQRYARVGIITFDKNVQFYDLRAGLNEPQLMIMSDVSEPFVPLSSGLFFDPTESREIALSLLDRLPKLFQDAKCLEACLGAAACAGYEALVPLALFCDFLLFTVLLEIIRRTRRYHGLDSSFVRNWGPEAQGCFGRTGCSRQGPSSPSTARRLLP
jgi:protein transport protein SEC24